ncbi:MAG: hypothetical protein RR716_05340 [Christensenellaceae bacterium]
MSDIADGLTSGDVCGYIRHKPEYWNNNNLINELFAHQFELSGGKSTTEKVLFQKWFSQTSKVFSDMIKTL